jgi:tellurite resistance protein
VNPEEYIHKGLSELGPTQFLEALSSVCMDISASCGNNTDTEKASKNQWMFVSSNVAKLKRNMEKAQLTSPFIMRRLKPCPRTDKRCDDARCGATWCQREEHFP